MCHYDTIDSAGYPSYVCWDVPLQNSRLCWA